MEEKGVKGLRALGVRVPDPERALAQDGNSHIRTDENSLPCSTVHRPLWVAAQYTAISRS